MTLKKGDLHLHRKNKIKEMYRNGKSYVQIGEAMDITRERVRQILNEMCGDDFEFVPRNQKAIAVREYIAESMPYFKNIVKAMGCESFKEIKTKLPFIVKYGNNSQINDHLDKLQDPKLFKSIRAENILDEFKELVLTIGYVPTSTYMQRYKRALGGRMDRNFGSYSQFIKVWNKQGYKIPVKGMPLGRPPHE